MLLFLHHLKANPLALSLLIPCVLSVFLALEAWKPKYAPRGKVFAILMLATALWSAAYGLELASTNLKAMLFWLKVEYLAIPYIPFLLLIVVMQYAGISNVFSFKKYWYLLIIPVLTMFFSISHEYHTIYYKSITLDSSGTLPLLELNIGIWYYVHAIYSYLLILWGLAVVAKKIFYQRSLFRSQLLYLLYAVLVPLITFSIYFAGLMPVKNIDPTPFAFAFSGLLISVSIFRYRMLDLMPIAREHIFQSMGDGLVVIDTKQRLVDCNPIALKIFDWKKTPFGAETSKLWEAHPDLMKNCMNPLNTNWEFNLINNEGEKYFFLGSISEIRNHKQVIVGKLLIIHDITQRYLMQESLRKSEENLRMLNAEKDKLFSIIAHDLRGPIGSFIGITEMFTDEANDLEASEMKRIIKEMNRSAVSLQSLLENLLNWSRMQRKDVVIQKTICNLHALCEKTIDVMSDSVKSKEIYLKNSIDHEMTIFADENMMLTVLRNLISNAVKFTKRGGSILLQSGKDDGNKTWFKVRDTGIGMPPEILENLYRFDKKTSRRGTENEPSSGLGLMLCKEFIEKNDGHLVVESIVDKGTTFTIYFPSAEDSRQQNQSEPS